MAGMQNRSFAQDTLTSGVLTLDCAAFGEISSSPAHFGQLAVALVTLLALPDISFTSIEVALEGLLNNENTGIS